MAEGIISNLPPEFSRRDELAEDALDPGLYERRMCTDGYLVGGDREYGDFLRHFVWLAQQKEQSRDHAKLELAMMWEHRPDEIPWPTPPGVDYWGIAEALIEEVWPSPWWREGSVDTSEMHVLVVNGGCLDEEPERVDVALIGPDEDDGVIVEFLPMEGVDPEEAEGHRRYTGMLVQSRAHREFHPWRSVEVHCHSTSNAYGPLRFNLKLGIRPLQYLPHVKMTPTGLVAKQPPCAEGIGKLGRFKVYNKRKYVGIHLVRDELTIKGWIAWLTEDSVAVVLTQPILGGCVRRTISPPSEGGGLVDDEGQLNGYGLQVVVDLLNEMYEAAIAMDKRLPDIMSALPTAKAVVFGEEMRFVRSADARLLAIWNAMPEPPFEFDVAFFKSIMRKWGQNDPAYFDNCVWWV